MKLGSRVALVILSLVALAHLLRLVLGVQVTVETTVVPMWVSVVGTLLPAAVAWLLWREGKPGAG